MNLGASFVHSFYINFIRDNRWLLMADGLKITLIISVFAILVGIFFGSLTTLMRRCHIKRFGIIGRIISWIIRSMGYLYVDIIRGTPMVTQLLIVYFVIFASWKVNPVLVAIFAFGFNSGAYVSEIIRGGLLSIDKGQTEAGRSLGFSSASTMLHIIIPQAVKNILPMLCNEFVVLIKETAVVGYLAIADLTRAAEFITSRTFDFAMPLITAAIIYYVIIKLLTLGITKLERYLRKADVR